MLSSTKPTLQSQSHVFLSKEKTTRKATFHLRRHIWHFLASSCQWSGWGVCAILLSWRAAAALLCCVSAGCARQRLLPGSAHLNKFNLAFILEGECHCAWIAELTGFRGLLLLFALIYWTIWLSFRKSAINSYVEWFAFSRLSSL